MTTRRLDAQRTGANPAKRLVIFLHGYGADGADLLGLSDVLTPYLPDTCFVAPNAPERSVVNPTGYQWFPIPWIDGSSEEESRNAMMRAVDDLNTFLAQTWAAENLSASETVLFGFSQGTMMSLHVAPRLSQQLAGVVAFSGRLLQPEALADDVIHRPPVLLVHGDKDDVVPPDSMPAAAEALQAAGWKDVYAHIQKGTGHGIAQDGLETSLAFMREVFDIV